MTDTSRLTFNQVRDMIEDHVREAISDKLGRTQLEWSAMDLARAYLVMCEERDALHAIVEGRSVAPTREERVAHFRAHGGAWMTLAREDDRHGTTAHIVRWFDGLHDANMAIFDALRWWPLDADGRPCAWPRNGGSDG